MTDPTRCRTARWLAVACLCLPVLAGCSTQYVKDQRIQDDLNAAMQRAQAGKTQEAKQWIDRAIAVSPKEVGTYVSVPQSLDDDHLGIADAGDGSHGVLTSIGDDADVVAYMTQAANKLPNSPLPLQVLEQTQGRLGDAAGQRATAGKLAALLERQLRTPGHALGAGQINQLAQAYWDAGDAVNGAANYRRVIATYPRDLGAIDAYNGLAYAYAVANDKAHLPEALTLAQTALRLTQKLSVPDEVRDPETGAITDTIGWVQYRLGDYHNALVNIQKGVNSNPRLAEGRYHLATVYQALGDTEAARMELNYAVRLSQGYAAAKQALEDLPKTAPASAATTGSA